MVDRETPTLMHSIKYQPPIRCRLRQVSTHVKLVEMSIKVLLADDHRIVRDGLRGLLEKQLDIQVVGEANNGRQAVAMTRELKPDVVIMDIGMRELNGIDATRQLKSEHPEVSVVALSMHTDRRHVAEMLAAGASGYVLKESAFDELVTAIQSVSKGQMFLSQGVSATVLDDYVRRLTGMGSEMHPTGGRALSPREREVLQLIAEGHPTKEIASRLHLSVKTIETHRRQIMDKLGIYNIAGLIKYALREGFTTLDD